MPDPQYIFDVMSGKKNPPLRAALSIAEPFYSSAARIRNFVFDRHIKKSHRLSAPVISIGNITTGGTGKTPTVRWLAEKLLSQNLKPAILMRGYGGDEDQMLRQQLPGVQILASPDRVAAAKNVHPDVFILDDGFQHRRIARDFDLVLVNATNPFGYNHVLPRGLLREPLDGLSRASAFLITHASESDQLASIEKTIRRYNTQAPIYRADHQPILDEKLKQKKFFAFAGIGDPLSLERALESPNFVGHRWLPDHVEYSESVLDQIESDFRTSGAELLVTTHKDAVKLGPQANSRKLVTIGLTLQFYEDHEEKLLQSIHAILSSTHSHNV